VRIADSPGDVIRLTMSNRDMNRPTSASPLSKMPISGLSSMLNYQYIIDLMTAMLGLSFEKGAPEVPNVASWYLKSRKWT
jgi:hypothetical protein